MQRLTKGQVVAVEGKTLRGSHDRTFGKAAIERVGAVEADAYRLSVYADRESVLVAYVALRALAV